MGDEFDWLDQCLAYSQTDYSKSKIKHKGCLRGFINMFMFHRKLEAGISRLLRCPCS